jgi:hypothetical protein
MWRSVVAVTAGCLAMIIISGIMIMLLGIFFPQSLPNYETTPSLGWAFFLFLYYLFAAAVGGYLTSHIASISKFRHVQVLALVVLFLGLIQLWAGMGKQPTWYLITQVLVELIGIFLGGSMLRQRMPVPEETRP